MTTYTKSDTGDPAVARRLVALAERLPGGPPSTHAQEIFSRRDVQEAILSKILSEGGLHYRNHPLYAAFDLSIDMEIAVAYADLHTMARSLLAAPAATDT